MVEDASFSGPEMSNARMNGSDTYVCLVDGLVEGASESGLSGARQLNLAKTSESRLVKYCEFLLARETLLD